jgi:putative ABC transport system permease protein
VNSLKRSLDLLDLAWALGLVAIAIGLAQWQRLGIAEQMAIAAARSLLQLLVMGFGLQLVWQLNRPLVTIGATIAASNRISDKAKNLIPIVGGAILTGLTVALAYTIFVAIDPTNWHQPQYLLAGNTIAAILVTQGIAQRYFNRYAQLRILE